jgi:anti-sigma B factor antagonist
MEFSYNILPNGELVVIELSGRLMEKEQALELLKTIDERIKAGNNKIVLSMKSLEYMNSSGLNILVNILTKARSASGEVVVSDVSPKINELFIITKLNTLFTVWKTREEAIGYFKK